MNSETSSNQVNSLETTCKTEINGTKPTLTIPVSSPDDKEKKYWHWLDEKYSEKLRCIRLATTKLMRDCEAIYPQLAGYTPHGPDHSRRVENIIHRLIPGNCIDKLRIRERFYLLASAWVHDVGMLRGLNGDHERDLQKFSDDKIRREHHKRSEKFIVNQFSRLDIDQEDAQVLGLLSLYHRRSADLNNCPKEFPVFNRTIQLRLLAAYLRLADSLDIDQSRSPASDYAICIAYNISGNSKLHWIKSRLVSGVCIENEKHKIVVYFKEPHESDLREEVENLNLAEKDIPSLYQNIESLRKIVINDLLEELNTLKNTLIQGGISYFLDIEERRSNMVIDNQIFPELILLANNFDMISHPSATRLMYMVLETVERIVNKNFFNKQIETDKKINHNDNECIENINVPEQNAFNCDQKNELLKKELHEFIHELECQILKNRKCHIGLTNLVNNLKKICELPSKESIKIHIENEKNIIIRERSNIRIESCKYIRNFFENQQDTNTDIEFDVNLNLDNIDSSIHAHLNSIDSKDPVDFRICINIIVYGYSELVVKALCGFRDFIVHQIVKILGASNKYYIKIHKINIEEIASRLFKIYVCEGQPKTITAPNDALAYHDGSRYATALTRRGFNQVYILPDLVVGNILYRSSTKKIPRIHFVMLGANGLEFQSNKNFDKFKSSHLTEHFKHSSGHLAIATLTHYLKIDDNHHKSRLILVLGSSKCTPTFGPKNDTAIDTLCCEGNIDESDGYKFSRILKNEAVRLEPFLVRDEVVRKELYDNNVYLYNPREDAVPLEMVDDIILDFSYFINVNNSLDDFREKLSNKILTL